MAKTLCYGATYSSLSFCPPQNLSPSLALFAICFCPSTYLITTLSAFQKQTDLTSEKYKIHEPFSARPVSKKIKKSPRSSASSPFHHPLPPLGPPRQLSLPVTKIRAPRLPSKNSDRCLFGFPLKLFPAPFQVQVPKP